jgi:uncharacterized membrane protein YccC
MHGACAAVQANEKHSEQRTMTEACPVDYAGAQMERKQQPPGLGEQADSLATEPNLGELAGGMVDVQGGRDRTGLERAQAERTEPFPLNKWQSFWRGVLHVDTTKMEPWIALRNSVGVAIPLAVGTAVGMPLGGVAVASGALNVSYSDGHDPYKDRAKRMLASSALCALAVMAGGLAGHHNAAAVALATIWAFGSGMAITLGPTAESLGVISIVVLVIYSAQALTPERALQAGGLAFAGGVLQTLLSLALWPVRAYEPERRALAHLYRTLGQAAGAPAQLMKAPPPAEASTQAQQALAGRATDHSIESERLRSLLTQAERMRLRLFTLGRLLRRMRRERFGFAPAEVVEHFLEVAGRVMTAIAGSLEQNAPLRIHEFWVGELRAAADTLRERHETGERTFLGAVVRDARFQMDALSGQLRAATQVASDITVAGMQASKRREQALPWRMRVTSFLPRLEANLTLRSAVFRHGVRLAIGVALAETLSRNLETPRAYWLPMTTVLVLKPEFAVTFTRGLLRIAGTIVGLFLATALFHFLPVGVGLEVVLTGAFVFLLRWVGPANYGIFGIAVSALVVLMIAITGVDPKDVILARGINTVLGGGLALLLYAVWPTWERTQFGEMMARLLDSYRVYFAKVVDALEGREGATPAELDRLRLDSRLARTNAVASVDRMQAEPGTRAEEILLLNGMLATSHRFIHAVLSVEAAILPATRQAIRDEFRQFARDVCKTLEGLAAELRGNRLPNQKWPDLREDHRRLTESPLGIGEQYALVNVEADRMANSLNTLREQVEKWRRLRQQKEAGLSRNALRASE